MRIPLDQRKPIHQPIQFPSPKRYSGPNSQDCLNLCFHSRLLVSTSERVVMLNRKQTESTYLEIFAFDKGLEDSIKG